MANLSDLGVMGLAVMGANLARNAARKGFGVALYNRHGERTDKLMEEFGHEGRFTPTKDIAGFVAALSKPRVMIIMVKAGKPVDDVIDELVPHLEEGDIIIDGGNSLFTDTDRRFAALKDQKLRFIGMGVSGGEEGALEGPSMMPGGERDAYARIEPMVTKMAAQVEGTPCATYIGARRRRPLRQDGAQRHRIRRHAAHHGGLRPLQDGLRTRRACHRRHLRKLEDERARQLPRRHHDRGSEEARRQDPAGHWSTASSTKPSRRAPGAGPPRTRWNSACP